MNIIKTPLDGVIVFEPRVFADDRGFFLETWSKERYEQAGINADFVQDNISFSTKGTLRGLHFQYPNTQGKLVQVLSGSVYDVAVDIRADSPDKGKWFGIELNAEKHNQMYIAPGFAHGFYVLSETALFSYKCTDYYSPKCEGGIIWNDPQIAVNWPCTAGPVLSDKDVKYGLLSDFPEDKLPRTGANA